MIVTHLQQHQWNTNIRVSVVATTEQVHMIDGNSIVVGSRAIDGDVLTSFQDEIQQDLDRIKTIHPTATEYWFALYAIEHHLGRTIARYAKTIRFV